MKTVKILFSTILILILSNCSGGSRDLSGGGLYCPLNSITSFGAMPEGATLIDEFSLDEKDSAVKEILTPENLEVGQYKLSSMDFMYLEIVDPDKRRTWLMTQVRTEAVKLKNIKNNDDTANATLNDEEVVYRSRQYCAGGYKLDTEEYSAEMTGISEVTVYSEDRLEWQLQSIGYRWNSKKLMLEPLYTEVDSKTGKEKPSWTKPEDSGKYEAPKDVFGENIHEMKLYKLKGEKSFLVYSKVKVSENVYYLIRTIFEKEAL